MRGARAVKRLGAVQAMKKLAQREASPRVAPIGSNFDSGSQHKGPVAKGGVGDRKIGRRRFPHATRPEDDVEIERTRPPGLPRRFASEMPFDAAQPLKQRNRLQCGRDQRGGIGIATLRWTKRRCFDDPRTRKNVDIRHFQRIYRLQQYPVRPAGQHVRLVRAERDQVEMPVQRSSTSLA